MKLWVARDLDGTLGLLDGEEPKPILGEWMPSKNYYNIDNRLFPDVTFENSPQEIEIKSVNNIAKGFEMKIFTSCKPFEGEFSKFVDDNFDNLI